MKYEYVLVKFSSWWGFYSYELRFQFDNVDKFEKYVERILKYVSDNYSQTNDFKVSRSLSESKEDGDGTFFIGQDMKVTVFDSYLYNTSMKEDLRRVKYLGPDYDKYVK